MTSPHAGKRSSYLEESDFGFQPRSAQQPSPSLAPSYHTQSHAPPPAAASNLTSDLSYPPFSHSGVVVPLAAGRDADDPSAARSYQASSSGRRDWEDTDSLSPDDSASAIGPRYEQQHRPGQASVAGLSYVDERGEYYSNPQWQPVGDGYGLEREQSRDGLVSGAADMAGRGLGNGEVGKEDGFDSRSNRVSFNNLEYADAPVQQPPFVPTRFQRVLESVGLGAGKYPLEQRIENRRRGIGRQRRPWAVWTLSLVMVCVMVYELVRNQQLTGSIISTKPTFNWMIGPSSTVLINIACFNNTAASVSLANACTIADACGLKVTDVPKQTWRFITPVFMHAGIVHIGLNVLVLLAAGGQIERELGWLCFLIIFFAGAEFGFLLGGNFALPGVPSVGASGGIFAVNAVTLVDLIEHWQFEDKPKTKLTFLILELLLMIGLGFIPLLIDNFSHLGGFAMGLLLGVLLYPTISTTKRHRTLAVVFKVLTVPLIVIAFVLVTINFYKPDSTAACQWCRYLSCLPVAATNYCKGTGLPAQTTTLTSRRMLGLMTDL